MWDHSIWTYNECQLRPEELLKPLCQNACHLCQIEEGIPTVIDLLVSIRPSQRFHDLIMVSMESVVVGPRVHEVCWPHHNTEVPLSLGKIQKLLTID